MASESKEIAESVVELDILPQIIFRYQIHFSPLKTHTIYHLSLIKITNRIIMLIISIIINCSVQDQNRLFKKCAAFVLRSVSKHCEELAQSVVDNEGLQALKCILEEYDPSVKEAGCWALSHIARYIQSLYMSIKYHTDTNSDTPFIKPNIYLLNEMKLK